VQQSQPMVEPRQVHWVTAKHVLRYLHGTIGYGLRYTVGDGVKLKRFTDLDWAGSAVDRKSTSRCCFSLGSTMVSWFNKKQTSVALSTVEAEYIAACATSKEVVWLQKLLADLSGHELNLIVIFCNNQSCVKLSENFVFHSRSKHIDMKYYYIRDIV